MSGFDWDTEATPAEETPSGDSGGSFSWDAEAVPAVGEVAGRTPSSVTPMEGGLKFFPEGNSLQARDLKLQALFERALEAEPDREAAILQIAKETGAPPRDVVTHFDAFKKSWETSKFDATKWREQNPDLARMVLERPELAGVVMKDQQLSAISQMLNLSLDVNGWLRKKTGLDALSDASMGLSDAMFIQPMDAPGKLWDAGKQLVGAFSGEKPATAEEKREAGRIHPTQVPAVDDAVAQEVKQGSALERAVAIPLTRWRETMQHLEIAKLNNQLMRKRMGVGARPDEDDVDAFELELRIAELKQKAIHRDLDEGAWEQVLTDTATMAASQVEVYKGAGKGAIVGAVLGGLVGLRLGPAGARAGAVKGAGLFAKAGMALTSFTLESGSAYGELGDTVTDDGKALTNAERTGGALLYGTLSSIVEVTSETHKLKALGPLGKAIAAGQDRAAIAQLKLHMKDRSFRQILSRFADAYVKAGAGEAGEEFVQDMLQQVTSYMTVSAAQGEFSDREAWNVAQSAHAGEVAFVGGGMFGGMMFGAQLAAEHRLDARSSESQKQVRTILQAAKDSPTVKADPEAVAKLIERQTAANGEPVTHAYIDPAAFSTVFQKDGVDAEQAAAEILGETGAEQLREAIATGKKLEVPMSVYLQKIASTDTGAKLANDTTLQFGHMTPNEQVARAKEIEEEAKRIAAAEEEGGIAQQEEVSFAEQEFAAALQAQLEATGASAKDAKTQLTLFRAMVRTMAKRAGLDPAELFRDYAVQIQQGDETATPIDTSQNVQMETETPFGEDLDEGADDTPTLAAMRAEFGNLETADRQRALFLDRNTGLLNTRGFRALPPDPSRRVLAELEIEGGKFLNDAFGHEALDGALRAMAQALRAEGITDAAKMGGSIRMWVADPQRAAEIAAAVQARINEGLPPEQQVRITAGSSRAWEGEDDPNVLLDRTFEDTAGAHKEFKTAERAAGRLGHRKGAPVAFMPKDAPAIAFEKDMAGLDPKSPEAREVMRRAAEAALPFVERIRTAEALADTPLGEDHEAAFVDLLERSSDFDEVFIQPSGLLTDDGFARAREVAPKKYVVSADMRGLAPLNDLFGKEGADVILGVFAELMAEKGGREFDAAHPHGDEFFAQGDDAEALKKFFFTLQRVCKRLVFFAERPDGSFVLQEGIYFVHGIGTTLDEADRVALPAAKEKQGDVPGPKHLTAAEFDAEIARLRRSGSHLFIGAEAGAEPTLRRGVVDFRRSGVKELTPEHLEQVQKYIARLKGERRDQAQRWFDYCRGVVVTEPKDVPTDIVRKMAQFFVVPPEGLVVDQHGTIVPAARRVGKMRSGKGRGRGEMPSELRKYRMQNSMSARDFAALPYHAYKQGAFHGSPHRFEKFSLQKIGTGEGAQAYGWGLYFAGRKAVAEYYREALTQRSSQERWTLDDGVAKAMGRQLADRAHSILESERASPTPNEQLLDTWQRVLEGFGDIKNGDHFIEEALVLTDSMDGNTTPRQALKKMQSLGVDLTPVADALKSEVIEGDPGQLYEVSIPEDDELLDYEAPLLKQPPKVIAALDRVLAQTVPGHPADGLARLVELYNTEGKSGEYVELLDSLYAPSGERIVSPFRAQFGSIIYRQLTDGLGGEQEASEALLAAGIPGLRYLDSFSRSAGEGSANYVIWDDGRVAVTRTYYQTVAIREGKETLERYMRPDAETNTRSLAEALERRQRQEFGTIDREDRSDEAARRIAKWMAEEVEFEFRPENHGQSGVGWYTEKFQAAIDKFGDLFPELKTDKGARNVFTALVAVTSDGQKVYTNFKFAAEAYAAYRKTGKMPTTAGAQRSFSKNYEAINDLISRFGPDKFHEFLLEEMPVRALKEIAQQKKVDFKTDYPVDQVLPMAAAIFGPKLGAFYANLMGASGYLTMDRWWSRTFNRMRGQLIPSATRAGLDNFKWLLGREDISDDEAVFFATGYQLSYAERDFRSDFGDNARTVATPEYQAARSLAQREGRKFEALPKDKLDKAAVVQILGRREAERLLGPMARLSSVPVERLRELFSPARLRKMFGDKLKAERITREDIITSLGETEVSRRFKDDVVENGPNPKLVARRLGYESAEQMLQTAMLEKAANTIIRAEFQELEDTPFNATDRSFMIRTAQEAQKMLAGRGINITIADLQAALWYYEKRLYADLGAPDSADESYQEVAERIVAERGGNRAGGRSARRAGADPARGADRGAGEEVEAEQTYEQRDYQPGSPGERGVTEEAPDFGRPGDELTELTQAQRELAKFEEDFRKQKVEHAAAVGGDGQVLFSKEGGARSVQFTNEEIAAIRADGNASLTHNHPAGFPFSVDDILLAVATNMREMRAVMPDGEVLRMVRPAGGWGEKMPSDPGQLPEAIRKLRARLEVAASYWKRRASDLMDAEIRAAGGNISDGPNAKGYSDEAWRRANHRAFDEGFKATLGAAAGWTVERVGPRAVGSVGQSERSGVGRQPADLPPVDRGGQFRLFESKPQYGPRWYSSVERAVNVAKQAKNTGAAWLAFIRKSAGVKAEEIEFLGLDAWLTSQKGSITREQVLEYINAHRIEVTEKVLGGVRTEEEEQAIDEAYAIFAGGELVAPKPSYRNFLTQTEVSRKMRYIQEGLEIRDIDDRLRDAVQEMARIDRMETPANEDWRDRPWSRLEHTLRQIPRSGDTKYDGYASPDAKKYREVLFYAPGTPASEFEAPHFDQHSRGMLAHARISERKDASGQPILFIEEIQSDLHQQGREHGYRKRKAAKEATSKTDDAAIREVEAWLAEGDNAFRVHYHGTGYAAVDRRGNWSNDFPTKEEALAYAKANEHSHRYDANSIVPSELKVLGAPKELVDRLTEHIKRANDALVDERNDELENYRKVPDAPFKTTWEELVAKRLLRWAAENGYPKIAWTTGEQQAERYDLSRHVQRIVYRPNPWNASEGVLLAYTEDENGKPDGLVFERPAKPADLPGLIGKDLAERLLASEQQGSAGGARLEIRNEPYGIGQGPKKYANWKLISIENGAERVLNVFGNDKRAAEDALEQQTAHERARGQPFRMIRSAGGQSFSVGGEGMRAAYDQRIPSVFRNLTKKHGGKVQRESMEASFARVSIGKEDGKWNVIESGELFASFETEEEAKAAARARIEAKQAAWTVTLPESLIDQVLDEGLPLFQGGEASSEEGTVRGYTNIARQGMQRIFRVVLTKNANNSTFLHESAHLFLELFADIAERQDAPESVKQDWAKTLQWFGVTDRSEILTEHHEKWARGFEAYLMEGKAPSAELAGPFERFKLWLKVIYKSVKSLGVELSDDIRGVFDRLLATDAEIARMRGQMGLQPMFQSPDEAGMTPEQWQAYLASQQRATDKATRMTELRVLKDRLRQQESWWREELARHRAAAEEEYEELPARRVQRFLRGQSVHEGRLTKDADVVAMDRAAVEAAVGPENAKRFITAKAGAVKPDEIADLYGYATGAEMLQAVVDLPSKSDWVKGTAEARMNALHPDILQERERLQEVVGKGLHGDFTEQWLLRELAALEQKANVLVENPEANKAQAIPRERLGLKPAPVEAIKRAAKLIADKRLAGRISASAALRAERAAADKAVKAAARKNWAQAIIFKQQQLLNMYLHRELSEARGDRDDLLELAKQASKDAARARLGKASPVYRGAVDLLLETFGFTPAREHDEPLPSLNEAVAQMEADGGTVMFDVEAVNRLLTKKATQTRKNGDPAPLWQELTVAEMREVLAALKNLRGVARARATALVDGKREDKEQVIAQLVDEAERALPNLGPESSSASAEGLLRSIGGIIESVDGSLLKPSLMVKWLGGGDQSSMWYRAVLKPLLDGKAREVDLLKKTIKPVIAAFEKVPKKVRARFMEKVNGAQLFPTHRQDIEAPTRRFELLMMALNAGNESNLQRLLEGRGITQQQLDAAIATLTKEELDWVQSIWDASESLWPEARALEERDSGLAPPKVKARELVTPHGTYRGGYFPAVYDRRVDNTGERQQAQAVADLMDPRFTRPGTSHSHLKRRAANFAGVISLEPTTISRHLAQVAHDIAFREAVKSVGSLILSPEIQAALKQRLGDGRAQQFLAWVKDVGMMRGASDADRAAAMMGVFRKLRGNTVVSALGFSIPTALSDLSNFFAAVPGTGLKTKHWAAGALRFFAAPMTSIAEVEEKSGQLRARRDQVQRELQKRIADLTARGPFGRGPLRWMKDHAFVFLELTDRMTTTPIWMGAYRQALAEGKPESVAVSYADGIVLELFPSLSPVDSAGILRDKGFVGFSLMFYGFFNTAYNRFRDIWHPIHTAEGAGKKTLRGVEAAARTLAYLTVTSAMAELLAGRGREDDEEWGQWYLRKLLTGGISVLPFGSEVSAFVDSQLLGKRVQPRVNPVVDIVQNVGKAVLTVSKDDAENARKVRDVLRSFGPLIGIPATQLGRTGGYLADLFDDDPGDVNARNPADVASGLIYGERDNQPVNPANALGDAISGER